MKAKSLSTKTIIITTACVATVIAVLYMAYLTHRNFKEEVISQTQEQLLSTAKNVAMNLEEFIVEHSAELQVFSADPRFQEEVYNRIIHDKPDKTYCPVKNFYEAHQIDINAVTLLDAKGIMLHRHPFIGGRPGMDHTDKPGIAYVIREHKPHISQVFYNNLGNPAISISEPIFYKGEFAGIVRWMIETATLSKRFVESVTIGNNGYMWMFDNRHVVLSHPRKDFVGMSVLDVIRKTHKERGELFDEGRTKEHIREEHDYLNRVKTEEEGCGIFVNCMSGENDIVAYKRVPIEKAAFNLILTLPYTGIAGPIYEHEKNIFVLAGLVVLLLGGGGVLLFRSEQRKSELMTERRHLKQITESAEAVRESEEKYRALVETTDTGFVVVDGKYGKVLDANSEYIRLTGHQTLDEILDRSVVEWTAPYDQERNAQEVVKCFERGFVRGLEIDYAHKNGKIVHIDVNATVVETKEGPEIFTLCRDITERKQAEEGLHKYESIISSVDDPMSFVDKNYIYRTVNDAYTNVFNLTREEIIGHSVAEMMGEDAFDNKIKVYLDRCLGGEEVHYQDWFDFPDGKKRFMDMSYYPYLAKDGTVSGIVVNGRDMTELELARSALKRAYEELNQLFNAAVPLCVIDKDYNMLRVNDTFCSYFGMDSNEIVGNKCYKIWQGPLCDTSECPIRQILGGMERSEYEVDKKLTDGRTVSCVVTAIPYRGVEGKLIGVVENFTDITWRKEADDELKQSRQQLRDLSSHLQSIREEERTHIAREIHDDLGQVLTALKLDIHWLANRLTDDQALLLEKTKSMSRLVDTTIHSVQRISSELRPGLLDDLGLSAAIEWLAGQFTGRSVIKCDFTSDPEEIVLDRDLSTTIFRVFQEAMTNVARHANAIVVDISLKQKSDAIELKVRDNGKGITEEQISDPRSFGLIGMRERVHSFGGNLHISSTPNEGTTIMVCIPFNKEE